MIEVLMEYRVDPRLVEVISKLYEGDRTLIDLGEDKISMEVTSGIRQGKIRERNHGYEDEAVKINSLFYADDGLILADSICEAERKIEEVSRIGIKYGLKINVEKSQIVMYNIIDKPENVLGIPVREQFKYLGVMVSEGRNCLADQRKIMIKKS